MIEEDNLTALLEQPIPAQRERRFAWVMTGSGHYLEECLQACMNLPGIDLLLTRAAEEVLPMYGWPLEKIRSLVRKGNGRMIRDSSYSSVPVGLLYRQHYHTIIIAPATSNTVAKCVAGISDTLATNMYAQAGKCGIDTILFACDATPVVETQAPHGTVVLYPRAIDLENTQRLAQFCNTHVCLTFDELRIMLAKRVSHIATVV